jgi:hypothetical protein
MCARPQLLRRRRSCTASDDPEGGTDTTTRQAASHNTCASGSGCCPTRLKTFSAKNGTALSRPEWHSGLFPTSRAGSLGLNFREAVSLARHRRGAEHRNPLSLTSFTALGLILELLIMKEKLFPGSKNKFTATIHALQHLVLKLHLRLAPFARFHGTPAAKRNCGGAKKKQGCLSPPRIALGLGPPRTRRHVGTTAVVDAREAL